MEFNDDYYCDAHPSKQNWYVVAVTGVRHKEDSRLRLLGPKFG
jgi:hypothetical protein